MRSINSGVGTATGLKTMYSRSLLVSLIKEAILPVVESDICIGRCTSVISHTRIEADGFEISNRTGPVPTVDQSLKSICTCSCIFSDRRLNTSNQLSQPCALKLPGKN